MHWEINYDCWTPSLVHFISKILILEHFLQLVAFIECFKDWKCALYISFLMFFLIKNAFECILTG